MEATNVQTKPQTQTIVITPEQLFDQWQGHRRITRRTIEAFPEDKLFTYSVGGMRPFAELVLEFLGMAVPGIRGVVSGEWSDFQDAEKPRTKAELLALWDEATQQLEELWPQIPAHRFQEVDTAFGQYKDRNIATILYFIDNEIHHRGQAFVYLRSLGITPPAFYDRS